MSLGLCGKIYVLDHPFRQTIGTSLKKIRYGIIGYGLFAERAIAPAIQASVNSELVAVQKRSMMEARERAAKLSIPFAFSTADELVRCDEVDAVFIVSANSAHCPETITAARAGKHVLVRNPSKKIFWHLDHKYIITTKFIHQTEILAAAGIHILTVVDEDGNNKMFIYNYQGSRSMIGYC